MNSTSAYITEEADIDSGNNDNAYTTELYNMYKVFTVRKKDLKSSKAPACMSTSLPIPPPASTAPPVPSNLTSHPPQYWYQASTEDQALTKELLECILKGTLDKVTPAHILAASPLFARSLWSI
jgi:hypothetical protein